ncbi:hypothetical protein BH23CHL5_BH23CHL5_28640 [soil metagenome]
MDIMYGIFGVLALTVFAAVLGIDVGDLFGNRVSGSRSDLAAIDPNSTLGVTQAVLQDAIGHAPEIRFEINNSGESIMAGDTATPMDDERLGSHIDSLEDLDVPASAEVRAASSFRHRIIEAIRFDDRVTSQTRYSVSNRAIR